MIESLNDVLSGSEPSERLWAFCCWQTTARCGECCCALDRSSLAVELREGDEHRPGHTRTRLAGRRATASLEERGDADGQSGNKPVSRIAARTRNCRSSNPPHNEWTR